MYRARILYVQLLFLFVIIPILTHADSALTFRDSSQSSAHSAGNWSYLLDHTNSIVDVRSQGSAVTFTPRLNLTLIDFKDGGANYADAAFKSRNGQNNDDQGEDEDEDGGGHHARAVPEPRIAATLTMGLALLFLKLRRRK